MLNAVIPLDDTPLQYSTSLSGWLGWVFTITTAHYIIINILYLICCVKYSIGNSDTTQMNFLICSTNLCD